MADTAEIRSTVLQAIESVTGKKAAELEAAADASFTDDMDMTSVEFFPIIAELEEAFGVEIDFAGYLNNATSVNATVAYLESVL